jgi:hypothetical protein
MKRWWTTSSVSFDWPLLVLALVDSARLIASPSSKPFDGLHLCRMQGPSFLHPGTLPSAHSKVHSHHKLKERTILARLVRRRPVDRPWRTVQGVWERNLRTGNVKKFTRECHPSCPIKSSFNRLSLSLAARPVDPFNLVATTSTFRNKNGGGSSQTYLRMTPILAQTCLA